jgi:hypothetical protein
MRHETDAVQNVRGTTHLPCGIFFVSISEPSISNQVAVNYYPIIMWRDEFGKNKKAAHCWARTHTTSYEAGALRPKLYREVRKYKKDFTQHSHKQKLV